MSDFVKDAFRGGMLDFVKNAFRKFIGGLLWLNLILCTIGGALIGSIDSGRWGIDFEFSGLTILGLIIGFAAGILTNIVGGGFIATILNIDKSLEHIKNKTGSSV